MPRPRKQDSFIMDRGLVPSRTEAGVVVYSSAYDDDACPVSASARGEVRSASTSQWMPSSMPSPESAATPTTFWGCEELWSCCRSNCAITP